MPSTSSQQVDGTAAPRPDEHQLQHGIAGLVVLTFPVSVQQAITSEGPTCQPSTPPSPPPTTTTQELRVVWEDLEPLPLHIPYSSGYLAFREVPAYQALLQRVRQAEQGRWVPQVTGSDVAQ
jgi:hypothetical protein